MDAAIDAFLLIFAIVLGFVGGLTVVAAVARFFHLLLEAMRRNLEDTTP